MKRFFIITTTSIVLLYYSNCSSSELNEENYTELKDTMGVVLVSVNWGRKWKCANYENAQLEKLKFQLIPINNDEDTEFSVISLISPSRLFVDNKFLTYAFIVKPGKYAFTEFSLKVARSSSDVGYIKAGSDKLIISDEPAGGYINVEKSGVIYIGHFFIDCYKQPIPWRYYPEGRADFNNFIKKAKKQFGFLSEANINFSLFKTNMFGSTYDLPD